MAEGYQPPEGYLTFVQAAERLGISRGTLTRRVKSGELPTFKDGRNRRATLVRVEDVDRLRGVEPVQGEGTAAA